MVLRSSCETWPVHSFVLAFTVVQLRDVFTVLCRHNAQPTALSTSPDPAPPHPLSSNSSPHISSRRSGPTRHHIFHWEFSTPTSVQLPPKEVLGITALLEHCLQVSGISKHIELICLLQKCVFGSKSVHPLYSRSGCLLLVCNVFSPLMCPICLA